MGQIAFSRDHLDWLGVPSDLPEDTYIRASGSGAFYKANRLMQCNTHPMTGKGRPCWGSFFYSGMALRIGLAAPQSTGLYVTHATFINFDRPGLIAVTSANRNCAHEETERD